MPDIADDAVAAAMVVFLRAEGAENLPHAGGRTLLDHLLDTYWVVRRWDQPRWLQHAALIHSVYGTDSYERRLLDPDRRAVLARIAGDHAERLAYLFCVTPRRLLFAGTHRWARDLPTRTTGGERGARSLSADSGRTRRTRAPAHGEPGRAGVRWGRLAWPLAGAVARTR
ncbi:MAG: hypothetical protein JO304_09680 [Solirubrobacterales bacterium]|nr:hypothetical protein [Solirubrobacterales bacterium]